MNYLYYNFPVSGIECQINVEFNPMATIRYDEFFHKITGVVNGVVYVDEQPISNSDLQTEVQRLRSDLSRIAQIVSNPESHGPIKMLRSSGFDFAKGSGPVKLNTPTQSNQTGSEMIDEY